MEEIPFSDKLLSLAGFCDDEGQHLKQEDHTVAALEIEILGKIRERLCRLAPQRHKGLEVCLEDMVSAVYDMCLQNAQDSDAKLDACL
jgi:hypothetical protein